MSQNAKCAKKWLGILWCCLLVGFALSACGEDNGNGGPIGNNDTECDTDDDCPDGVCDDEGECVSCLEDDDCEGELLCQGNTCVECTDDDHCDGDYPVCRLGSCAECNEDDDCDEMYECSAGTCTHVDLCKDVDCPPGQHCDEDTGFCEDNPADDGYLCHEPYDLGEFQDGESLEVFADPSDQPSTHDTSCSESDVDSGNAVFEFSVDEPMDVIFEFDDHDSAMVMEIRQEACDDPDAAVDRFPVISAGGCDNVYANDPIEFDAEPDTTYYIIIEARHESVTEPFEFGIETEALACAPKGMWTCDPDDPDELDILQCDRGIDYVAETCAEGCANNECHGDGCHNAIEVNGSMTIEGATRPYTSSFDFRPHPECSSDPLGSEGPLTDGRDLVFYLPDLEVGQVVIADGSQTPQTNYFGVVEDCDEDNILCLAGESHDQIMEWEVPDEGDYYVIFNRDSSNAGEFMYSIEILE